MAVQRIEIDLSGETPHITVETEAEPAQAGAVVLSFLEGVDVRELDRLACNSDFSQSPIANAVEILKGYARAGA